jgi:hypothetical protein
VPGAAPVDETRDQLLARAGYWDQCQAAVGRTVVIGKSWTGVVDGGRLALVEN